MPTHMPQTRGLYRLEPAGLLGPDFHRTDWGPPGQRCREALSPGPRAGHTRRNVCRTLPNTVLARDFTGVTFRTQYPRQGESTHTVRLSRIHAKVKTP